MTSSFNALDCNTSSCILEIVKDRGAGDIDDSIAKAVDELREKDTYGHDDRTYLEKLIECSNSEEFLRGLVEDLDSKRGEDLCRIDYKTPLHAMKRLQQIDCLSDEEILQILFEYGENYKGRSKNFVIQDIPRLLSDHRVIEKVIDGIGTEKIHKYALWGVCTSIDAKTDPGLIQKALEKTDFHDLLFRLAGKLSKEDVYQNEANGFSKIISSGSYDSEHTERYLALRDKSSVSAELIGSGFFDLYPDKLTEITNSMPDEACQGYVYFVDYRATAQERLSSPEVRNIFGDLLDDMKGNAQEIEAIRNKILKERKENLEAYHIAREAEEEARKELTDHDLTKAWANESEAGLF
ncbi:hypothetical protein KKC60_02080 [Patescibacteria group bacterium]|nr:hypothetical protein [Patescibacteria group bacterium]